MLRKLMKTGETPWTRKTTAYGFGVEPVGDFRVGEPGEQHHERESGQPKHGQGRHHHPERAVPPIHRREQAPNDRPAQVTRGKGALGNRNDPGTQPCVEQAGDQRHAAAGKVVEGNYGAFSDSARRRLARKFAKRFGKEPPAGQTWGSLNTN